MLAKQVLSQLSYTPVVSVILLIIIPVENKTVADTFGFREPSWEVFFKRRIEFTHVLRFVGEPELPQVFLAPYEGRHVSQRVDQTSIDEWFERYTADLNERQRTDLKRKFASTEMLFRA